MILSRIIKQVHYERFRRHVIKSSVYSYVELGSFESMF